LDSVTELLLIGPVLLFSMVAHEYAHGWVAMKNGDPTAYQLGRLTWNPIKHIDPFMTILLPAVLAFSHLPILGGAKPIPVNPRNYRNFKQGDIMVSLAGIVTNVILALIFTAIIPIFYFPGRAFPNAENAFAILQQMCIYGIWINLVLAVFNLTPIPPLDGSHVFKYVLPPAWALSYERISRYGLLAVCALLFLGGGRLLTYWLLPATSFATFLTGTMGSFILPWQGAL
jgi:Zn-dependent protease